ncbi:MAG: penicillin-binding transpeptidase domain-containing protein [Patescibacteria group bacterium]
MELSSSKAQSWLSWFLRGILVLFFLFLISRLFELQIIKGKYFRELSDGNRIKRIKIAAPRGKILARGGETLVGNLGDGKRNYVLGSIFAHAGGYLGEANEEEIGKIDPKCPEKGMKRFGGLVGRGGLEEQYDCILRGVSGEELTEVDIKGKYVRTLGKIEPSAGQDVKTNIDIGLQKKAAGEMAGKKGGIIATDAKGEVLAFYSSPSFDPNNVVKSLNDPALPLFNRITGGLYHPGSVFKPTVVAAALEEGEIDKNYRYSDTGIIRVNDYSYTNWYFTQYGRTEGEIGVVRAIARSTDTFFYKIGEDLGIGKMVEYADKFGYSQKTGIDIPGEMSGLIPTPEWKKKAKNEAWFLGNTYHFAIGQGDIAVSPIEVNRAIEIIGNGGEICQPKIVGSPKCKNLNFKNENLDLVRNGMEGVCNEGGTGYTFFDWNSDKKVACKTGTAETNTDSKTHAWFTLFYPSDFPEITLTVLVEGGGEGSKVAGPIARKIMDYWRWR